MITNEMHTPIAVSVKHACTLLGVGKSTLWAMWKDDKLDSILIGRKRLVLLQSIHRLVESQLSGQAHTVD